MLKKLFRQAQGFTPVELVVIIGFAALVAGSLIFVATNPRLTEPISVNVKLSGQATTSHQPVALAQANVPDFGFSQGLNNALYGKPPYNFSDCDFTAAFVHSNGDLKSLIPAPLTPVPMPGFNLPLTPDLILLEGACPTSTFGKVNVAAVFAPVALQGNFVGVYSLYGWDDNPAFTMMRRELYGCPARLGEIKQKLESDGTTRFFNLEENGVDLMKLSLPATQPFPVQLFGPDGFHFPPIVSLKNIPSIVENAQPDVLKLVYAMHGNQASSNFTWGGQTTPPSVKLGGILAQHLNITPLMGFNMKFTYDLTYGGEIFNFLAAN